MDYFGMLASFRSIHQRRDSKGVTCLFPRSELRGIGDESNVAYVGIGPVKISSHKGKRDEHYSFPKGLLPVENIKE